MKNFKNLLRLILALALALALAVGFTACGGEDGGGTTDGGADNGSGSGTTGGGTTDGSDEAPKKDIEGVSFTDAEFTYDGTEKSITVGGTVPEGVSVRYENASATDSGSYKAKAVLSGDGYNSLTLEATLTVNKATITGISAEPTQSVKENGEKQLPEYKGSLPAGVEVSYSFDGKTYNDGISEAGKYEAVITFSGKNYVTLELPVEFTVELNLAYLATSLINAFGSVPDVWSFLPEGFSAENHLVSETVDYSKFVNISDIPTNGIGKQMNVVYSLLNKCSVALGYVNTVYGALGTVKTLYTNYLDGSPDNYKHYEDDAGAFRFVIDITDDEYLLGVSLGSVGITVFANLADESYGARVQLTETTALKYTLDGEAITIAMDILDAASAYVEFARDENGNMLGAVYEYLTVGGKEITATSAMIEVGEDYTVIIGTKGDFIPTSVSRNCEIYDNETGKMVGGEVREDTAVGGSSVVFNTYWFPLYTVKGIESIMNTTENNGYNDYTIFINGYTDEAIHTTAYGINLSEPLKSASRRYDIEFKTMYFYKQNSETGEYESISMTVPMIFIQEEKLEDFETDFAKANKAPLGNKPVDIVVELADYEAIRYGYTVLLPAYDKIKDAVTHEMITDYCKKK